MFCLKHHRPKVAGIACQRATTTPLHPWYSTSTHVFQRCKKRTRHPGPELTATQIGPDRKCTLFASAGAAVCLRSAGSLRFTGVKRAYLNNHSHYENTRAPAFLIDARRTSLAVRKSISSMAAEKTSGIGGGSQRAFNYTSSLERVCAALFPIHACMLLLSPKTSPDYHPSVRILIHIHIVV